jgi:hypothetical protein
MTDIFHRKGDDNKEIGNVMLCVITGYSLILGRGEALRQLNRATSLHWACFKDQGE